MKETYITGACRFCNQVQSVPPVESTQAADELATENCDCPGARKHFAEQDQQVELAEKRKAALQDAEATHQRVFYKRRIQRRGAGPDADGGGVCV